MIDTAKLRSFAPWVRGHMSRADGAEEVADLLHDAAFELENLREQLATAARERDEMLAGVARLNRIIDNHEDA